MKPSEYLKNKYDTGYEEHVDEDELDKRFIDKEELKEKIIQMINEHKQQNRDKFKLNFDIKSITVEKLEEILKLLEE